MRSDACDAAFSFQCRPSKCAVAACPDVHTLATLAVQRGYKQVTCLDALGVSFDLSSGLTTSLKFCLRMLIRKLRFLRARYLSAALRFPRGIRVNCVCKGKSPSRPHVTWNCPNTASCRHGLTLPSDRAAERLFAAPCGSGPLHPRLLPMRS